MHKGFRRSSDVATVTGVVALVAGYWLLVYREGFDERDRARSVAGEKVKPEESEGDTSVKRSRTTVLLLLVLYVIALRASGAGAESNQLFRLDEHSAKGLEIQCSPAKTNFVVGEPVNVWCVVTNTTDMVKPVAWHPSVGSHFRLTKDEDSWMTGVLPQVLPQLSDSVKIRSIEGSPEYVLLLPPRTSLRLLLTHKPERPGRFRGIVVYDPVMHGGGFFGNDGLAKAKRACIFSREFEYEVTASEKKR